MREFFESLTTIEKVQALIDTGERESNNLEYKRAAEQFGNPEKGEIAKDVSSFANSGGGIIIFGMATDQADKTKPVNIEGIAPVNIETFDRVVNSRIQPPIAGWQKKLIPQDNPRVMVILIPQSDNSPHQNLFDHKYYRRAGIESIPMTHDLIAVLFGRTQLRQNRLSHLREELYENQQVVANPYLGGLVPRRFQTDAWEAVKVDMGAFEEETRTKLRNVYSKIRECNQLVDDFERRQDGRIHKVREIRIGEIRPTLDELLQVLRDLTFTR